MVTMVILLGMTLFVAFFIVFLIYILVPIGGIISGIHFIINGNENWTVIFLGLLGIPFVLVILYVVVAYCLAACYSCKCYYDSVVRRTEKPLYVEI